MGGAATRDSNVAYDVMVAAGEAEARYNKAELQLTDIADALQADWVPLARQLGVSDEEVYRIQTEYDYVCEQALVMLHLWVHKNGEQATGAYAITAPPRIYMYMCIFMS